MRRNDKLTGDLFSGDQITSRITERTTKPLIEEPHPEPTEVTFGGQTIYSAPAAREARDEAMERAEDHAEGAWKKAAMEAIRETALAQVTLTADDVQKRIEAKGAATHDNRALGPMMKKAAKAGLIESTHSYTPSTKKHCHATTLTLWRSKIAPFTGDQASRPQKQ